MSNAIIAIAKSNAKRAVGADGLATALLASLSLWIKAVRAVKAAKRGYEAKRAVAAMAALMRGMTGRIISSGEKGGKGNARHHLGTASMTDCMSNALQGRWSKARLTAAMASQGPLAVTAALEAASPAQEATAALKAALEADLKAAMDTIKAATPIQSEDDAVAALRPLLALLRALDGKDGSTGKAARPGRYEAATAVTAVTAGSINGLIEGQEAAHGTALKAALKAQIWAKRPQA